MQQIATKNLHILSGIGFASIFGLSFLFTAEALVYIDPFHLLSLRFCLAFLTMTFLKTFKMIDVNFSKDMYSKDILILILFQPLLYFSAENIGVLLTSSSQAGLILAIIPILTAVLGGLFLKEYPQKAQIPFIIFSVFGVILIVIMQGRGELTGGLLGSLLLMCSAIAASGFNILSRKLSKKHSVLKLTFYMMFWGSILFTTISLSQHLFLGNLNSFFLPLTNIKVLIPILYLSILSSVVAFFLINYTLAKVSAAQASVFTNLITVIAVLAGVLIRNEPFYSYHIVGGILIIAGVAGTNYYSKKATKEQVLQKAG